MKKLAFRSLDEARNMAENAARGVFPSHAKCPNAVKFDYKAMADAWKSRRAWQVATRKEIAKAASKELSGPTDADQEAPMSMPGE